MDSPYSDLPPRAFWRSAVTERESLDPGDLYVPKFRITRKMRIVTAGSCFAQHVGRTLRESGFNVVDTEPAPSALPDPLVQKYGYRLYSARYGNIYTVRQLVQLLDEVEGSFSLPEPAWERGGRFFDPMRPGVEPEGLASADDVALHRKRHLEAVDEAFSQADIFVFTFGLTEAWVHAPTGTVYPTAPGTIAGQFDPAVHRFENYGFPKVFRDFVDFRSRMQARRPGLKFIVTVSPVPLTATASGQHVEVATAYSKAVLRAVAGAAAERFDDVDYFPSYEIITSQNNRGVYFEPNKRSVSRRGVDTAMGLFLKAHAPKEAAAPVADEGRARRSPSARRQKQRPARDEQDVICEEALLEAFRK